MSDTGKDNAKEKVDEKSKVTFIFSAIKNNVSCGRSDKA
jgi:hypothetical protein